MGVDLLFLRGPLKDMTTSFAGAIFTGLELKRYSTKFTTKGGVSWCLSLVKPINNSSRLNSKIIATKYCYQLLLQIFTEAMNCIIPGFAEGAEKGTGTTVFVVYSLKPKNILKRTVFFPPRINYFMDFRNTYYIYTLT